MKKINFEAGKQISAAKVTIDDVDYNVTPAVYEGNTPLSPYVLNKLQDNVEVAILPTQTTDIAEKLIITDCAGVKGKIDIKSGKSTQDGEVSLDNVVSIRNVGDNINLYDGEDLKTAQTGTSFQTSLKENTGYNLSFKKSRINSVTISNEKVYDVQVIRFYNSGGELLSEITGTLYSLPNNSKVDISIPFTTPSSTSYAIFHLGNNNGDNNINTLVSEIKIEKGLVATGYSEYGCGSTNFKVSNKDNSQSELTSFPFTEGQRLYKDGYLANNGIHNKRKTIVFDGTEDWQLMSYQSKYYFRLSISDIKASNEGLCSHLSFIESSLSIINYENSIRITDGCIDISFDFASMTIDTFKSILAEQYANGTPITLEYGLAEEIVTPYTTEQEEAYYQLQHLLMYEGYTKIECIDEIKPDIQVTYSYNNEINTSYGKKIDTLEERIRQLEKTLTSLTSEVSS